MSEALADHERLSEAFLVERAVEVALNPRLRFQRFRRDG